LTFTLLASIYIGLNNNYLADVEAGESDWMTTLPRWSKMSVGWACTRTKPGSGKGGARQGATGRTSEGVRRKRRSIDLPKHCAIDFKYRHI